MNHLTDDEMAALYYGDAKPEVREHVAQCAECRAKFEPVARILEAVREVAVAERGPEFEQRIWSKIGPEVRKRLEGRSESFLRRWMLAPALAGLLTVAFLAGMYTQHRSEKHRAFPAPSRERVLMIAMGDHLERSQMVLAEIANAPEGSTVDISSERKLASGLLNENRLLRQTALHSGNASGAAVLDDLERVLLEIAHSPEEVPQEELDSLKQRIEAQGLLFKIRVVSSNIHEKGMKL